MESNTTATSTEVKETRKRTVSTAFLETVRTRNEMTVVDFVSDILKFSTENNVPGQDFQDMLSAYADSKKLRSAGGSGGSKASGVGNSKGKEAVKAIIAEVVERSPMGVSEVSNIAESRKGPVGTYAVKLIASTGAKLTVHVDLTDLSNVILTNIGFPIGTPVNVSDSTNAETVKNYINKLVSKETGEQSTTVDNTVADTLRDEAGDFDASTLGSTTTNVYSSGNDEVYEPHLDTLGDLDNE